MRGAKFGLVGRILAAGALVLAFLVVEFLLVIMAFDGVRSASDDAELAQEAISTTTRFETLILDLETGERGYVITRDRSFLQPWRNAVHELPPTGVRLRALEHEQADGHDELTARLVRRGNDYLRWTLAIVKLARTDNAGARARVASGGGKRRVDRIRRDIDRLLAGDARTVVRTRRSVVAAQRDGVIVGAAGIGGALVLFLAIVGYFLSRAITPVRRIAAGVDRVRSGDFSARVPESGAGEVGDLGRGFNAMAQALEGHQRELQSQNRDLERLANSLQAVLDSTIDGILLSDRDGNIQLANRPLVQLTKELGMTFEGTATERLLSIADTIVDRDRFVAHMRRLEDGDEEQTFDEFEVRETGRVFQGFTSPVRDDRGVFVGRIWTMREVTQERELDRLKDEFVATVSHELRTPLTSMMGFLEMLREGEAGALTAEQDRFLGIVYRSSERLQRLVGDLLFVARLDANGLQLAFGEVHLPELVEESVEAVAALARAREIDLHLEAEPVPPLRGDRERLAQLVSNLLSNALKFTPAGGTVTARVSGDGNEAFVEVEDTGIGIPRGEQSRLFQRFFRSSTATEQAIPGTGLGLVITKAIAEAHGGSISVRSQPGAGTCFRVLLPLDGPIDDTPEM